MRTCAPTLVANRSACSHTCEHTRHSTDRHLFVGPASATHARGNARDKEWNRWEREGGTSCWTRQQRDGRGVSSRCVYAGGYRRKRARVYREWGARACTCASFQHENRTQLVRVYARAYPYACIRRTPRCISELPTARGVHHPRLTGGTRFPPSRPLKPPVSPCLFRSSLARSRAANPTHEHFDDDRMFVEANR